MACGDGQPSSTTPALRVTLPPPSADVSLDLDLADKLRHEGDLEQAMAIYSAVAQLGEVADQRRALQSLAHTHYQQGRFDDAAATLTSLLDLDPPSGERQRVLLLLGAVQQQMGLAEAAREAFHSYIEGDGVAASHAHLKLAAALSADGDEEAALAELNLALTEGLPRPRRRRRCSPSPAARRRPAAGRRP